MVSQWGLAQLHKFDELDPKIKERFRNEDLDFVSEIWFQCSMLTDDIDDRFKMYKKWFWS